MVALEGTCYAGKTTLAHALATHLAVPVVPEYADLAPNPPFPPADQAAVHAAINQLLAVERQRARLAAAAADTAGRRLLLLDRSPLSCIAFQYAVGALGVPCDHQHTAARFAAAAHAGRAVLPAAYLYLRIDRTLIPRRQHQRGPVMACLTHPRVLDRLDHAYERFLSSLPAARQLVLDGGRPIPELIEAASTFIAIVPALTDADTAVMAWTDLAALLGDKA